jgi:hypothetical protein
VGLAVVAEERGWGFFKCLSVRGRASSFDAHSISSICNVMFHAVPALWRLHRMPRRPRVRCVNRSVSRRCSSMAVKLAVVAAWTASHGGTGLRGAPGRHVDVQPQQRPDPASTVSCGASCDARHASGHPQSFRTREQQLRLQPSLVGPTARDLPCKPAGHEGMTIGIEPFAHGATVDRPAAAAAVSQRPVAIRSAGRPTGDKSVPVAAPLA